MVEAKLLLVQDWKPAVVPMPTAGNIDAAEAERRVKEMEGAPVFGCNAGIALGCFDADAARHI